jgi:3-oxoacyl-[acyl-carrier-protein] synthase II
MVEQGSGRKENFLIRNEMAKRSARPRVVVTGYGMMTPLGRNSAETFENARNGVSGIDFIRSFDTKGLPCRIGGEVDDTWLPSFDDGFSRRIEKYSARALKMLRAAASEACALSRLDTVEDRERIGVSVGFHGENPSVDELMLLHRFYDGNGQWDLNGLSRAGGYSCFGFFRRKPDVAPALLAKLFDCRGTNLSIVSACAAGTQAIGEAYKSIKLGECDVMIAGGSEASLNFAGFVGFVLIKALCEKYAAPQKASRPFDRRRNGFIMSEGAATVVLEELEHARARRAPIFGEILGYGSSADAHRITDTHPKGDGAVLAMQAALADASRSPADVDYINAHGTSTVQNDLTETLAIKKVFGSKAKEIPVSSNKSMLGHTIAAAGAIECILTLMGINQSVILPTMNYEYADPKCDLDYVPNEARQTEHRIAISNSFGFGGQNACLCLSAFE